MPYVESEQTVVGFDANIDQILGVHSDVGPGAKPPSLEGSVGTEYFAQDRVTLVSGRMPDLADPGQALMNAQAGKELGIHVGSTVTVTLNSDAQLLSEADNPPPAARARLRIVGLVVFPQDVVNDDYDTAGTAEVLVTPALTRRIDTCCATYSYSSLRVAPGHAGAVESELTQVLPSKLLTAVGFRSGAPVGRAGGAGHQARVDRAGRVRRRGRPGRTRDRQSDHRAPATRRGSSSSRRCGRSGPALPPPRPTRTLGTVAAVVGRVRCWRRWWRSSCSPLFPFGPVRPVFPYVFGWDWTVLGLGCLAFVVILSAVALGLALRMAPERVRRRRRQAERPSVVARAVASSGLPAPAMTGLRFALGAGGSREAVPVRSAILGATLAILVIVATVTFGSSLNSLIGHPPLYGWNWNYALFSGFFRRRGPAGPHHRQLLAHDPSVTPVLRGLLLLGRYRRQSTSR